MLAKGREPPKLTDLDGDGLVDHVLRIPGAATYWKRNISGKYGQLTQVNLPQGGNVEIDYAEQFGTPDNPNFKYVMSRVTMNDGTDKDDVLPELKHCNTRYGTNYTADDLQGLNSDTISDKNKIYAGNHLNLGKAEDVQKRAADYTSRATTQDLIEQVTPERKEDHHLRNGLLEIGAGLTI